MSDYKTIKIPTDTPAENYRNKEGFIEWYNQKSWGTEKGSLGREKQTTGKILDYDAFIGSASKVQGK
mgnify:CR=1 FL=1|jgi:hypothetical protein